MTKERRRSHRYALLREEIAVVHDLRQDRPATLVDFSATGALLSLVDVAGFPECNSKIEDRLELSLQGDASSFYVRARIVRRGPRLLAVEFVETRPESLAAIEAKIERLAHLQLQDREPQTRTAQA
jgi:c-di-GMP-binding flagellar brake protein YcgR